MYAIMGATGQVGGATAEHLHAKGARLRVVTRAAARADRWAGLGAEIVAADARDTDALAHAFAGTQGIFVMNAPSAGSRAVRAEARLVSESIAAAAARSGTPHVVALSSEGAHLPDGNGMIDCLHDFEQALKASGVTLSVIRPTDFLENWGDLAGVARAEGIVPSMRQPIDAPFSAVSARDVGRVAAELLLNGPGAPVVHLYGPAAITAQDVAAVYQRLFDRPVAAIPLPREAWVGTLSATGMTTAYAEAISAMYDAINAGRVAAEPGIGRMERGLIGLEEVLTQLVAGPPS